MPGPYRNGWQPAPGIPDRKESRETRPIPMARRRPRPGRTQLLPSDNYAGCSPGGGLLPRALAGLANGGHQVGPTGRRRCTPRTCKGLIPPDHFRRRPAEVFPVFNGTGAKCGCAASGHRSLGWPWWVRPRRRATSTSTGGRARPSGWAGLKLLNCAHSRTGKLTPELIEPGRPGAGPDEHRAHAAGRLHHAEHRAGARCTRRTRSRVICEQGPRPGDMRVQHGRPPRGIANARPRVRWDMPMSAFHPRTVGRGTSCRWAAPRTVRLSGEAVVVLNQDGRQPHEAPAASLSMQLHSKMRFISVQLGGACWPRNLWLP